MAFELDVGTERMLVSYDVSKESRSNAVRVCQIVFGRTRGAGVSDPSRREKGFIHRPGVVWIGQSVLAMPPRDAEELRLKLGSLGVRLALARIHVSEEALEAFQRPSRSMA